MALLNKTTKNWTKDTAHFVFVFGLIAWFLVWITTIGLASYGAYFAATVTATFLVGYPTWILLHVSNST